MERQNHSPLAEQLLKPPALFKRENFRSFLYVPYSRKIHRRIYCYGEDQYNLWVFLESDCQIGFFNERVPDVPISIEGRVKQLAPSFVAQMRDKSIVVHIVLFEGLPGQNGDSVAEILEISIFENALNSWATEHKFSVKIWTRELLHANQIRLENLKRLLRYVCVPQPPPLASTKELIYMALRQSRKATIDSLLHSLSTIDDETIMAGLAGMILDGTCYSDIDFFPWHYSTELSVHHAFVKSNA